MLYCTSFFTIYCMLYDYGYTAVISSISNFSYLTVLSLHEPTIVTLTIHTRLTSPHCVCACPKSGSLSIVVFCHEKYLYLEHWVLDDSLLQVPIITVIYSCLKLMSFGIR